MNPLPNRAVVVLAEVPGKDPLKSRIAAETEKEKAALLYR